jgi:hypothetical protein
MDVFLLHRGLAVGELDGVLLGPGLGVDEQEATATTRIEIPQPFLNIWFSSFMMIYGS